MSPLQDVSRWSQNVQKHNMFPLASNDFCLKYFFASFVPIQIFDRFRLNRTYCTYEKFLKYFREPLYVGACLRQIDHVSTWSHARGIRDQLSSWKQFGYFRTADQLHRCTFLLSLFVRSDAWHCIDELFLPWTFYWSERIGRLIVRKDASSLAIQPWNEVITLTIQALYLRANLFASLLLLFSMKQKV